MSSRQDNSVVPMQQNTGSNLDRADIVIIGNGIAGLTAAVEARHLAPDKHIVIITDQMHPTINTPALKQFAVGKLAREQLLAYPPGTERSERIHVVMGHVEEIHAQSKYVSLNGKRAFGYDSLLIATGSRPMGLPENIPGRDFDGVMVLHRLQDYLDFRRRIPEVTEAVVIGGGVLANETVMGLLYWGIRVHWLIRGKKFMRNMLDETASDMVLENVRHAGAIIHTETEVTGVVARVGSVVGVITNRQEMIPCQLVLSCTGTQAVTELAKRCTVPMRTKKGILVDDKLRTSVRDIYAAGDVAAVRNPLTGEFETHAQWYSAVLQARIAGAVMAGHKERTDPFGVAWHATHLGELYMLTVGEALSEDRSVEILTDSSQGNYRRLAVVDGRLVGYLSMGTTQPDSLSIKRIIDEGLPIRNVIKPLLKGTFDGREFLSQVRSRMAEGMLTGKLPDSLLMPRRPTTALSAKSATTAPRETPIPPRREPAPAAEVRQPVAPQSFLFEEEISPFTGNLPSIDSAATRTSGNVIPTQGQRIIDTDTNLFAEEIVSPFTGNLPTIAGQNLLAGEMNSRTNISGGNLSPVTQQAAEPKEGNSRKLWAYAEQDRTASRTRG